MGKGLKKALLAGCGLVFIAGLLALFALAGRYLVYSDELHYVDVIVVLSGNDVSRIKEAAALYKQEIAYNIILTNSERTYGDDNLPYSLLQKNMLEDYGVPGSAIYVADFAAKNTGQEATGIINRMYQNSYRSAVIVTDAWHTRRVKTIFSDSFANTGFEVLIHPASGSGYSRHFWWTSLSGWRITVGEYLRILGYFIKRGTNIPDYPRF